jgi:GMP synthase (glutamine-hydrolysing)
MNTLPSLPHDQKLPVLLVLHRDSSNPGQIETALNAKGWPTERCCLDSGDRLPESLQNHAGVVIFGGPMSANDDHLPAIKAELDWIPRVLESGTPFFGVCLGAQMLARCLGAEVWLHPQGMMEIGYYPIVPAPQANGFFKQPMHVYHWHREGFDLPTGDELLAEGEIYSNQAFRYGRSAYGVQFHPEMQEPIMRHWLEHASHMLVEPGAKQPEDHLDGHAKHGPAMHRWLDDFILSGWVGRRTPNLRPLAVPSMFVLCHPEYPGDAPSIRGNHRH